MGLEMKKKIGQILIEIADLKDEDLQEALKDQEEVSSKIGEILMNKDLISKDELNEALAIQFGFPWVPQIILGSPARALRDLLSYDVAREHGCVPISMPKPEKPFVLPDCSSVTIAISDPLDLYTIDNLRFIMNSKIEIVMTSEEEVSRVMDKIYYGGEDNNVSELPKFLIPLMKLAIEKEGVKFSVRKSSTQEEQKETIDIDVLNKYDLWVSESRMYPEGIYDDFINKLIDNSGEAFSPTDTLTMSYSGPSINGTKISSIVVYPGKSAPRVDIYLKYSERGSIRETTTRLSRKFKALALVESYEEIGDQQCLLVTLKNWEDMLDEWLVDSGVEAR